MLFLIQHMGFPAPFLILLAIPEAFGSQIYNSVAAEGAFCFQRKWNVFMSMKEAQSATKPSHKQIRA